MKLREMFNGWMVEKRHAFWNNTIKGDEFLAQGENGCSFTPQMLTGYVLEFLKERNNSLCIETKGEDWSVGLYNDKKWREIFEGKTLSEALEKILDMEVQE